MTIDKAIKYADLMASGNVSGVQVFDAIEYQGGDLEYFGRMCADALRLAKKMSEANGLTEETEKVCSELKTAENSDCWQERMKREYRETKERYEKLHRMVTKFEAGVLEFTPTCSIELLKQQKRHMGEYLHDLEIRSFVEGVEL